MTNVVQLQAKTRPGKMRSPFTQMKESLRSTAKKLDPASSWITGFFVRVFLGIVVAAGTVLFLLMLWLRPFVCGVLNFFVAVFLVFGIVFYFLPKFSAHYHELLMMSFVCFLLSWGYESLIIKLSGDEIVRTL